MMQLSDVPVRYRKMHQRACSEGASALKAIRAHCAMCMGWEETARAIAECPSRLCPLWRFRTGRRPSTPSPASRRSRRIDASGPDPVQGPPDPVASILGAADAAGSPKAQRHSNRAGKEST